MVKLHDLLAAATNSGNLSNVDLLAGDTQSVHISFPAVRSSEREQGESTQAPRPFLVASLTKPIVATLAVQQVCEGRFNLTDRVGKFLPACARGEFRRITIRHLLTHTSGLPDMLEENESLRGMHASNADFVARSVEAPLEFAPATDCRYSSMAFAVLGHLMETIHGEPLSRILDRELFAPLGMTSTWLGIPAVETERLKSVVPCDLPNWQPQDADWNWNSDYWRGLGAPWGGLITTVVDLGRLSRTLLNNGCDESGTGVLSPIGIHKSFENQLESSGYIPEVTRRTRGWGYGWRHNWIDHAACFSDLLPANAVGHWGATGTLWWLDPSSGTWAVVLSTTPFEQSRATIQQLSNIVAADLLSRYSCRRASIGSSRAAARAG
jgi:CubicO group peptidase (beta-lactamase class C family)